MPHCSIVPLCGLPHCSNSVKQIVSDYRLVPEGLRVTGLRSCVFSIPIQSPFHESQTCISKGLLNSYVYCKCTCPVQNFCLPLHYNGVLLALFILVNKYLCLTRNLGVIHDPCSSRLQCQGALRCPLLSHSTGRVVGPGG